MLRFDQRVLACLITLVSDSLLNVRQWGLNRVASTQLKDCTAVLNCREHKLWASLTVTMGGRRQSYLDIVRCLLCCVSFVISKVILMWGILLSYNRLIKVHFLATDPWSSELARAMACTSELFWTSQSVMLIKDLIDSAVASAQALPETEPWHAHQGWVQLLHLVVEGHLRGLSHLDVKRLSSHTEVKICVVSLLPWVPRSESLRRLPVSNCIVAIIILVFLVCLHSFFCIALIISLFDKEVSLGHQRRLRCIVVILWDGL